MLSEKEKSWIDIVACGMVIFFTANYIVPVVLLMCSDFFLYEVSDNGIYNLLTASKLAASIVTIYLLTKWLKSCGCFLVYKDNYRRFVGNSFLIVVMWFAFIAFEYAIRFFAGEFLKAEETLSTQQNILFGGNMFLDIMSVGIFGPIAEELAFRGALYGGLRKKFGTAAATAISTAVFAVAHQNIYLILMTGVLGLMLALIYESTSNLLYPILLHMINNTLSCIDVFCPEMCVETALSTVLISIVLAIASLQCLKKRTYKYKNNIR